MSEEEMAVLRFERERPGRATSRKVRAIREVFGFSAARYFQILHHALADPVSDVYAPEVVAARRLQVTQARALSAAAHAATPAFPRPLEREETLL